jgi:hypothetical protein
MTKMCVICGKEFYCGAVAQRPPCAKTCGDECSKALHLERRRTYNQSPERKASERARQQSPERKAYELARRQSPERKARQRAYQRTPEFRAYRRAYQQTPDRKARNQAFRQTHDRKAYQAAYHSIRQAADFDIQFGLLSIQLQGGMQ